MTTPDRPLAYLTVNDVEYEYGIPGSTVRRWLRDGVLPYSKPGGKAKSHVLIARLDLDALLAASRVEATAGPLASKP